MVNRWDRPDGSIRVVECSDNFLRATPFDRKERMMDRRRIDRYGTREMRHSRSEDLLGAISRSPSPNIDLPTATSEDDLIAASALRDSNIYEGAGVNVAGPSRCILPSPSRVVGLPVDPEDSIRDIVTENDLYRSVQVNIIILFILSFSCKCHQRKDQLMLYR